MFHCLQKIAQGIQADNDAETLKWMKEYVTSIKEQVQRGYDEKLPMRSLISLRTEHVDQLLIRLWSILAADTGACLVAVGGYGRGELHPHSDIDLMILSKEKRPGSSLRRRIQRFLALLWDAGMDVGHSVRHFADCRAQAKKDITVFTNLLEARLLCGNPDLYRRVIGLTAPGELWSVENFFVAKCSEQRERHERFSDTSHNVEPHLKEGPGGLRDIQMIGWVAKRHFGVERLRELIDKDFLTEEEYKTLDQGRELLWRIRYGLHLLSGKKEDRLLFDYQKCIAEQFGHFGKRNRGVEEFMKNYYQTIREMGRLNEMLLQHFSEEILEASRKEKIVSINPRFQIRNDFIETKNPDVFASNPFALMEIFLLIQQNLAIKGVRASTIRLVRKHLYLINANFRKDLRARTYFLEIIRQPRHVGHELRRMHRYGVLGAYLPVFAQIQGLMQFDLFHAYTVDEHILFVVRNMRLFSVPEERDAFPWCQEVIKKIPKLEVLYIAGLFHDIAKGRSGDHSELGARDVQRFCVDHRLSHYDTLLASWLVKNHLLMSMTAHRQDINDPEVIKNFANRVADRNHLDYLYLLTVADICATNPDLWNSWKASLIDQLYHQTLLVLRRGMEKPLHKLKRVAENRTAAITMLKVDAEHEKTIRQFWKTLRTDYFLRHSSEELAWHAGAIVFEKESLPVVRAQRETSKGWSQILVYTRDAPRVFTVTALAMERLRLNVLDARIIISKTGYTLNTYVVLESNGEPLRNEQRCADVCSLIVRELRRDKPLRSPQAFRSKDRKLANFQIATDISFAEDAKNERVIMELITLDRVGVLSRVGHAMDECRVKLTGAKISTYGERVEDIFFIKPPPDGDFLALRERIVSALGQEKT
ncbi:MAG: [protein-PII] uridylyltransferase [Candidatus Eutrophobiaceae bacterium]